MAIDIQITTDTGDAEKGVKNLGDSLEKVAENFDDVSESAKDAGKDSEKAFADVDDSLKDVGDSAKDAGKDLEKSLGESAKDGAKDAEKGLEKVEDALEEVSDKGKELDRDLTTALKSVDDQASKAGKGIGDGIKKGTDQGKSSFKELGDEANSSAQEAASSFDGSAEGLIDTFREIAAEGGASFGLLGGAIGLGLAAGIGIALAEMQKLGEANTEAAQNVADLAAEFSDLGGDMDAVDIGGRIKEWGREVNEDNWMTFWVDEAKTNFEKYAELAKEADVNTKDAFRGIKGSAEDSQGFLDGTISAFQDLQRGIDDATQSYEDGTTTITPYGEELIKQRDKLKELRDAAQENIDTQNSAIDVYETETDVLGVNAEALAAQIDLRNELADANLSAAEADIALVEGTESLSATLEENGKTIDINTAAGRNNRQAVLDQVSTINDWAQAQIDAGADVGTTTSAMNIQKEALINQVAPYFGSRDAARSYIEQVLKTPKAITTDLKADSSQGQRTVNDFVNQRQTKIIDVRADTSAAEYAIASLNGRRVTVHADAIPRIGQPLAN